MIGKIIKLCLLLIGALLLVLTGSATQSEAEVKERINLPTIMFAGPAVVVLIPGTYVYMVPDIAEDVLFFQGYWWRPYEGHWYRSRDYKARSWHYVEPRRIPRELIALPRDSRNRLAGSERIPLKDLQKNWQKWEKEKYWDRRGEHERGGYGDSDHGGHKERR